MPVVAVLRRGLRAAEHRLRDAQGQARVRMALEALRTGTSRSVAGIIVGAVGVEGVLAHARDGEPLGLFYAAALYGVRALPRRAPSLQAAHAPRSACRGSSRSASCSSHSRRRRSCHRSSGWRAGAPPGCPDRRRDEALRGAQGRRPPRLSWTRSCADKLDIAVN